MRPAVETAPIVVFEPVQKDLSMPALSVGIALTVIDDPLVAVPPGPVIEMVPVVELAGIVTVIDEDDTIEKVGALVPLTEIEVTPERAVPVIVAVLPVHALAEILVIVGLADQEIVLEPFEVLQEEFVLTTT